MHPCDPKVGKNLGKIKVFWAKNNCQKSDTKDISRDEGKSIKGKEFIGRKCDKDISKYFVEVGLSRKNSTRDPMFDCFY